MFAFRGGFYIRWKENLAYMKNSSTKGSKPGIKAQPQLDVISVPNDVVPSSEQIDALALRLIPDIKRFFADEQIQKEFAAWLEQKQIVA